jgi:hypothetical protein
MIHFYCPLGHRLVVPDERAGKKGRCPVCHQRVYVPVADPRPSGRPKERPNEIQSEPRPQPVAPPPGAHGPFEDILVEELGLRGEADSATLPGPSSSWIKQPPPPPPPPARFDRVSDDQLSSAARERLLKTRWIAEVPAGVSVAAMILDPKRLHLVYMLAAALGIAAMLAAIPAAPRVHQTPVPQWVQIVLMISAMQIILALWIASIPDASTMWIGTIGCIATAALYGAGMGVVLMAPAGGPMLFDLYDVRHTAGGWCAGNVFLQAGLAYVFGQTSHRWRNGG